jgi:hypothetical protein
MRSLMRERRKPSIAEYGNASPPRRAPPALPQSPHPQLQRDTNPPVTGLKYKVEEPIDAVPILSVKVAVGAKRQ